MRRFRSATAAALFALAACSKPAANAAGAQAGPAPFAGAPRAAASGPVVLTGVDVPHFKAGEWEVVLTMGADDHNPADTKICQGDTEGMMAKAAQHCPKIVFTRTGLDTVTVDTACSVGAISTTTHAVMTGDFNSAFTADSDTQITGARRGPTSMHIHKTYRYVGPCPAGEKPDDGAL